MTGEENSSEILDVLKVNIVKKGEYSSREVQDAMQQETLKYRKFDAIEEVIDEGQP